MKKNIILALFTLTISQYSFALNEMNIKKEAVQSTKEGRFPASEPNYSVYAEECLKPAIEKLKNIAQNNNMTLDESTIAVSEVDDRWYNQSTYVWFSAVATNTDGVTKVIQTLTQKSTLSDCF